MATKRVDSRMTATRAEEGNRGRGTILRWPGCANGT